MAGINKQIRMCMEKYGNREDCKNLSDLYVRAEVFRKLNIIKWVKMSTDVIVKAKMMRLCLKNRQIKKEKQWIDQTKQ